MCGLLSNSLSALSLITIFCYNTHRRSYAQPEPNPIPHPYGGDPDPRRGAWMAISANLPGGTDTPGIPAPKAGFLGPDFTLETRQGETITLSDLRGRAVIVNVWASWCGPCRAEMPALEAVYREFGGEDLELLAVNATSQDNL